jgi:hypothetical protein
VEAGNRDGKVSGALAEEPCNDRGLTHYSKTCHWSLIDTVNRAKVPVMVRVLWLFVVLLVVTSLQAQNLVPKGCVSVVQGFAAIRDDKPIQALVSDPEKQAVLVFIADDKRFFKTSIAVDGELSGITGRNEYIAIPVPVGGHTVCAVALDSGPIAHKAKPAMLTVKVEAGRIYYFQQTLTETISGGDYMALKDLGEDEFAVEGALQRTKKVRLGYEKEREKSPHQ